jgi:hypothetical protein
MNLPSKEGQLTPKSHLKNLATLGGVMLGIIIGIGLRSRKKNWTMREVF